MPEDQTNEVKPQNTSPTADKSAEQLLNEAEAKLRQVKETGRPRNQSVRFALLRSLVGGRVVVQEKNGPIAIGFFESFDPGEGYLKLTDAQISGRGKRVSPPFVPVHFTAIAHIHPEVDAEKV